ncbi:MAG: DpnD/PcfM family protein, partial [Clostridiales bacterium]|nr:DpnD/PcfM family protein [Clostridiales bacterium]
GDKGNTDTDSSGNFEVTITETLRKVITVEADNTNDAEQAVSDKWLSSEYILDSGDFTGVEFTALPLAV